MRNAWATTLEQFWHSPTFPMWVTLAAASFFALVLLVTLVRAEKTVANGALTVITLLAIAIAVAAMVRRFDPLASDAALEARSASQPIASVAALSCLDGLAGEAVEVPCERALFASADVAAAAVSYTAAQISKLAPTDDPAAQTPEQQSLRSTLERDRYGLVARVLVVPFLAFTFVIGSIVHVHHIDPEIRWLRGEDWTKFGAQMEGTTVLRAGRVFNFFLHWIMVHTPHHVDMRIPMYNLEKAAASIEEAFPGTVVDRPLRFRDFIANSRRCKLYDFDAGRWLTYREASGLSSA